MIYTVRGLSGNDWCGPTAFASIARINYDEADAVYRKIRKSKRRVVHTRPNDHRRAVQGLLRKQGIYKWPYWVELVMEDGSDMPASQRPRVTSYRDLNFITNMSVHDGFLPIALIIGRAHDKSSHIVAYDHRKKRLCDNFSYGKVLSIPNHPLKDWFIFKMLFVPEEHYG